MYFKKHQWWDISRGIPFLLHDDLKSWKLQVVYTDFIFVSETSWLNAIAQSILTAIVSAVERLLQS